jgi:hypothetical protein
VRAVYSYREGEEGSHSYILASRGAVLKVIIGFDIFI